MSDLTLPNAIEGVAIIGMAGRFPKAKNITEFWHNLREGIEGTSFFTKEALEAAGIDREILDHPNYVRAQAVLEDAEWFDAPFFGYTPREAEIIDPQQRLFLECAWEALENAGYDPETYQGLIGVYAGTSMNSYLLNNLASNPELLNLVGRFQIMLGNDKDFLATRVSYKLNLKGPSVNVQTACSTSLVAVTLACQSLLDYQCDMALAGGVSVSFPQKAGYLYQDGGILSPDGRCRAFDSKAQGTFAGQGVGIVVLKRLEDAIEDRDYIYAVIKGAAINNDGSLKVGYTAPSVDGQAEVINMAQAQAGFEPETISYVEAHGTATPLGDSVEMASLIKAFRAGADAKGFCAIGSVKTNIGHLDAAAGVAGLIKTALALEHKLLPPSLHFEVPNPKIDFANSPFYVNTALSEWKAGDTPRRAGVSSFGIGGTNAHVVLEEAPVITSSKKSRPWHLLTLSARTDSALEMATKNLLEHFKKNPELDLADVSYTLQVGRRDFDYRRVLVCSDLDDAIDALETMSPKRVFTSHHKPESENRPVVFMFTGAGAQHVNMTLELYQTEPLFRQQIDFCAEYLKPHLGLDLRTVIYPTEDQADSATQQLRQTYITQSALFVIEYSLAKLWMAWGVQPRAMIGHSIGEYVAACLAGVFPLEEALKLVATRGRLIQRLPEAAMLAVPLPEEHVQHYLNGELSLSAVNSPSLCVVSGPTEAVDALQNQLAERHVLCSRLETSHAFHSRMLLPASEPLAAHLESVALKPPNIPFISNVSGTWITTAEATNPGYWARHLCETVRFNEGIGELLKEPGSILLEIGPGPTLSFLVRQHPAMSNGNIVLSSTRNHPYDLSSDVAFLLNTLGKLWLAGVQINWPEMYKEEKRRRSLLPSYPFERQRYWIEPRKQTYEPKTVAKDGLVKKPDITDWFYVPSWKRQDTLQLVDESTLTKQTLSWLLFTDNQEMSSKISERLRQAGQNVTHVLVGDEFGQVKEDTYTIAPHSNGDYNALLKALKARDRIPDQIIHLWSVNADDARLSDAEWDDAAQDLGFYSLLYLVQALGDENIIKPMQIQVVANGVYEVTGEETLVPTKATVLGLCRVIPQEYFHIKCRSIDIGLSASSNQPEDELIDQLLAELISESSEPAVAYRQGSRWTQTFEATPLTNVAEKSSGLRHQGVYLITGGLGGIGLVLAEYLAKSVRAKLILTGRSALPAREQWSTWLGTHDDQDTISHKIRRVQALEEMGAEVLTLKADVADLEQMQGVISQIYERFGQLNGVIYAAGIVSLIPLQKTGEAECKQQFDSKARGLVILEKLLQDRALDFCLLTSSLTPILGGLGHGAYAAANVFMDTFVRKHNKRSRTPWTSINWEAWRFTEKAEQRSGFGASLAEFSITPSEGVETFKRILARGGGGQVVVSTGDLQARIDQWVKLLSFQKGMQTTKYTPSHSRAPSLNLQQSYVAPRNELEQIITNIWQDLLGIERVGIHDSFFDLGGSSLLALNLFARIEKRLDRKLPLATLFEAATVAQLAAILRDQEQSISISWSSLVPIQPEGSRPPIFFVHAAGGNLLVYRDLAHHLGPDQPVYGLQSQGLDGKQPLLTKVEDMAALYLKEIHTVQPEGPYLLAGYCMGGTVALEMAQQLQAQGQKVALLVLLETYNWSKMTVGSLSDIIYLLQKAGFQFRNFFQLDAKGRWIFLKEKLKVAKRRGRVWYGLMRSKFDPSYFERSGRNLRPSQLWETNDRAVLYYNPKVYPGRIVHFCPKQEYTRHQGPELGWDNLATDGVETHIIPVYPGAMLVEPFVEQTARVLKDSIDEALETELITRV